MNDDYNFDVETLRGVLLELFPKLTEDAREKLLERLFEHLFVYVKSLLFVTDQELGLFNTVTEASKDSGNQKELVLEVINKKMETLSVEKREEIKKQLYAELVAKGHALYQSIAE